MGEEPNICWTPFPQLRAADTRQTGTSSGSRRLEDIKQTSPSPPGDILGAQLCILSPAGHRDPQGLILHVWGWLATKPPRVTCYIGSSLALPPVFGLKGLRTAREEVTSEIVKSYNKQAEQFAIFLLNNDNNRTFAWVAGFFFPPPLKQKPPLKLSRNFLKRLEYS